MLAIIEFNNTVIMRNTTIASDTGIQSAGDTQQSWEWAHEPEKCKPHKEVVSNDYY